MAKYLTKKILLSILTVLVIVTIVFFLMRLLPTDYYFTDDQLKKLTPEQKEAVLVDAGLRDPLTVQLKNYYVKLFSGDTGVSRRVLVGAPVSELIAARAPVSIKLGVTSLVISLVLGVLLGTVQTMYKGRLGDKLGIGYTVFVDAVPTIVSYSVILVVGTKLFHLPTVYSGRTHPVTSLIMPILCLSLPSIAGYALWTRRYMVDQLNMDYIKLAKMKGLSNWQVLTRHVLRNAIVPLVQYLPSSLLLTIGGSMLVESFFSIPGMGSLFSAAVRKYDLDVVQTLMFMYASLSVGGIVLGDLLMAAVDPRIKLSSDGGVR